VTDMELVGYKFNIVHHWALIPHEPYEVSGYCLKIEKGDRITLIPLMAFSVFGFLAGIVILRYLVMYFNL
jgi:hypothetical protein